MIFNIKMNFATAFVLLLTCGICVCKAQSVEIISPNNKLVMDVDLASDNECNSIVYEINYEGRKVILPSMMGLLSGNADWDKNLEIEGVETFSKDTSWIPLYGERSHVRDHFNATTITFSKKDRQAKRIQLEVRAYDQGMAFRYIFPENPNGGEYLHITKEQTQFTMPESTKAYFSPWAQSEISFLPIPEYNGESERPLTMVLPNGLYACVAEAEMVNFSRMRLVRDEHDKNALRCSLYGEVDEITPFATPWRVVMVANAPGKLLENNDILLNLNPVCQIDEPSWIKPGKVMREVTLSTEGAKKLTDFAVKRNLQYIHFDAGWYGYEYISSSDATTITVDPRRNPKGDLDIVEAVNYAKSKGIGVIVYVNQRALANQLDEILPLYKKWGIDGIKFGFVHVGSHKWTTWLHEAIKKCAKYGLVVDVHDEYRPTGFSRTYPNLLTQEGIRGNEEFPDATHNTMLPFTRFIAGAGDYTICYYRQYFGQESRDENGVPRARYIKTTSAHQLALSVVCYSPLQYMYWYDKPEDSADEPELAFFDAVPTVWDDTKVVQGEIGQFVTIARRSGDNWFVGTITNNDKRELEVSLDFLPEGKDYEATIYYDDDTVNTRTKVGVRRVQVNSSNKLKMQLKPSGGEAMLIKPITTN